MWNVVIYFQAKPCTNEPNCLYISISPLHKAKLQSLKSLINIENAMLIFFPLEKTQIFNPTYLYSTLFCVIRFMVYSENVEKASLTRF